MVFYKPAVEATSTSLLFIIAFERILSFLISILSISLISEFVGPHTI